MIKFTSKKNIFWDFDGVIMDSMPIRNKGFEVVLSEYSKSDVEALMEYHLKNGGLSRYVKFRYFFENIIGRKVSELEIQEWAGKFSQVMRSKLLDRDLLIEDSLSFIRKNHKEYRMHIVSGSDQKELRFLCDELGIAKFFISIHGSPTPKKELVQQLLLNCNYNINDTLLIGDSINDYDAANFNEISFYGYNNFNLKELSAEYINSFF